MFSIAICTFNRERSLSRTLQTLAGQVGVDWTQVEIIVIDNNCTDQTADVVRSFSDRIPIRRVVETAQGLSYARNRALAEFCGDWLIFTDDDVILDDAWLVSYTDSMAMRPDFEFFGGSIEPLWPSNPPSWYRADELQLLDGLLVRCNKGPLSREIEIGETLFLGASFAMSRHAIGTTGQFRTDLGVNGTTIGRGEETDFMLRAQRNGCRGWFIAESKCWHVVDPQRLKLLYLFRYGIASGIAHNKVVGPTVSGTLFSSANYLLRGLFQMLKGRGDRFRQCIINAGIQVGLRGK